MRAPILCLDFDGVIHSYSSGWQGARVIPDPPVPGALQFMAEALEHGWDVVVHSSRARYFGGRRAMRRWLREHAEACALWHDDDSAVAAYLPGLCRVRFSLLKPPALVTLDDRAVTFLGVFPDPQALRQFAPWNKRRRRDEVVFGIEASDPPPIG